MKRNRDKSDTFISDVTNGLTISELLSTVLIVQQPTRQSFTLQIDTNNLNIPTYFNTPDVD